MSYSPPNPDNWKGRKTDPEKGNQYWYQHVELRNSMEMDSVPDFGILGYVCEEGVKRNQGRVGAKDGPEAIRQKAGKMSLHTDKQIADFGDVVCEGHQMEACQEELAKHVTNLIQAGSNPIILGGGHDVAYGHFKGIQRAVGSKKKIGIINFDAHFDLRPVQDKPNSGTPFNQILSEYSAQTNYLAIGIQQTANTKELFEIADQYGVKQIPIEDCNLINWMNVDWELNNFIKKQDVLYVTVDMDGFSSAFAPGVSAPSALGFAPDFFFKCMDVILLSKKMISLDIAEMSPTYDLDGATAGLAARVMEKVCR